MSTRRPIRQWYGREEEPTERTRLRAGDLTAVFEAPDLRWVRLGEVELAQRLYMAVRDAAWNTIPADISDIRIDARERSFTVSLIARHRHQDIDYEWQGTIRGSEDGRISYEMDGQANSSFRYAKIGLLVHHPLRESVGQPYRARTSGGEISGRLPIEIIPQRVENGRLTALFPEYDRLSIQLPDGGEVAFEFEGDLWEMQDHRNWVDGNFKSYGTPMSVPFPFDAEPGTRLWQRITLHASGVGAQPSARNEALRLEIGEEPRGPLPPIGLQLASHGQPLTEHEAELLRAAGPAHLRVDLPLAQADHPTRLARAVREAQLLQARLELALHLTDEAPTQLEALVPLLQPIDGLVDRVLVFEARGYAAGGGATPPALVRLVRHQLRPVLPHATIAGGSNLFFAEITRDSPDPAEIDALVYPINPQVHASDDASLVENLAVQTTSVETARRLVGDRPVFVSPVTFIGSNGPYPGGPPAPGGLPGNVDVRQASLFGAAWTIGSVKHLAVGGADALTYFETTGWLGLIEREKGSPVPELFPSHPGMAFPLYHVFADLAEVKGGKVLAAESEDPIATEVLAVRQAGRLVVLIANLVHQARSVVVSGLPPGRASARMLDDATFEQATRSPAQFRLAGTAWLAINDEGRLGLDLEPLATVRLDVEPR